MLLGNKLRTHIKNEIHGFPEIIAKCDIKLHLFGPNEVFDFAIKEITEETSKCNLVEFHGKLSTRNLRSLPITLKDLVVYARFCDLDKLMASFPHLPLLDAFGKYSV